VIMANPLDDLGHAITGTATDEEFNKLPQVQAQNPGAYQIQGQGAYNQNMGQLGQQYGTQVNPTDNTQVAGRMALPGVGNYSGQNAGQIGNQTALQQYLQSVAMGQAPSAADAMLQTAGAQAARAQQSQAASMGGSNPALAMRQMYGAQSGIQGNIAGQAAQQKLGEQAQFGQMAGNLSQGITQQQTRDTSQNINDQQGQFNAGIQQNQQQFQQQQQQFLNQQQNFQNNMNKLNAQRDVQQGIYNASRDQTSYNVQREQNNQAFSAMQREQALTHQQDNLRSRAALIKAGAGAATAVGGGALMATGAGAPIGAAMLGGGLGMMGSAASGGGSSGMDPGLLAMMAQGKGAPPAPGNGGYVDPYSNDDGSMMGSGTGTVGAQ
jgi:hypothetical protein